MKLTSTSIFGGHCFIDSKGFVRNRLTNHLILIDDNSSEHERIYTARSVSAMNALEEILGLIPTLS